MCGQSLPGHVCQGDGGSGLVCRKVDDSEEYSLNRAYDDDDDEKNENTTIAADDYSDIRSDNENGDQEEGEQSLQGWVQVGVSVWGVKCGETGLPSVYSSMTGDQRCWLDQVISCY